ncbi:hypothetical protein [Mesorhizobium shangrilense]|uniref:Uncharacterized protein n=1 Tax=Mesorhizobium shangrilense TaxID=460060 RepID=A0ABV2DKD2_9HYPH
MQPITLRWPSGLENRAFRLVPLRGGFRNTPAQFGKEPVEVGCKLIFGFEADAQAQQKVQAVEGLERVQKRRPVHGAQKRAA